VKKWERFFRFAPRYSEKLYLGIPNVLAFCLNREYAWVDVGPWRLNVQWLDSETGRNLELRAYTFRRNWSY
jgi:hypothetical protein